MRRAKSRRGPCEPVLRGNLLKPGVQGGLFWTGPRGLCGSSSDSRLTSALLQMWGLGRPGRRRGLRVSREGSRRFNKTQSRIQSRATLQVPSTHGADPYGRPGTLVRAWAPDAGLTFPVWLAGPGRRWDRRVGGCCCPGADKGARGAQSGPQDAPWPGGSRPAPPLRLLCSSQTSFLLKSGIGSGFPWPVGTALKRIWFLGGNVNVPRGSWLNFLGT